MSKYIEKQGLPLYKAHMTQKQEISSAALPVFEKVADLRAFVAEQRMAGKKIALVPTMGALHEGHLELVRQGLAQADIVIATIFVNPAQFAPHEDLDSYPRTWDSDLQKLTDTGAHAVFYPSVDEMYPQGFSTAVSVSGVSAPLEGEFRPHFFGGVATVVAKLLLQALPDIALFGEKDYQQLQVIKRMAADLDMPVDIIGVPTVRDENGLALSSRNAYLSAAEYDIAVMLNKTLFAMADKIGGGENIAAVQAWGHDALEKAGFESIDYLEVRDAETLDVPSGKTFRILAAVKCGKARLIDNVGVL